MDVIDKNSAIPLYYQIKEYIKDQIDSGLLKPGNKLPTEDWYCNYFNVSRVTVRKALEELINDSLITRRRKMGAVVADRKFTRQLDQLTSLYEEMKRAGIDSRSKVIDYDRTESLGAISGYLNVHDGEPLLYIYRLRYFEDKPFALQKIYLRERICPGIDPSDLDKKSLFETLEDEYQLKIAYADQTISAVLPTRKQMSDLEIHKKEPLIKMRRISYLDTGEIFEYTELFYLSDVYTYSIRLYR